MLAAILLGTVCGASAGDFSGMQRMTPREVSAISVKLPEPAPAVIQAPAAKAKRLSLECSSGQKAALKGTISEKGAKLVLADPEDSLPLNMSTKLPAQFTFERIMRVNEAKYSFMKFYSDATAWEGFELSLPKAIFTGGQSGTFPAYFTVYSDNGDYMAPEAPVLMSCSLK